MSLRLRLLLVVVLLNMAVVGVVQVGSLWLHRQRSDLQQDVYHNLLQTVLADAYPQRARGLEHRWVRELLGLKSFRTVFRDVMVSSGAAGGAEGLVDLNPMGAAHRDAAAFSLEEVRAGILQAKTERRRVEVGGGLCVPVALDGEVELGAWYVPVELPTTMPIEYFAIPVLLCTALIGVLAFWSLGHALVRPMRSLGGAASRVGAGDYDVKVEPVKGLPEMNVLVDAFNAMAAKVAGHTDELRSEVQRATEETERRERALIVSSRLAAMGTLAAGIAHEINNPIGGMLNAARRLAERDDLDERGRLYLELILEGLNRVGATTRKVLDFSPRQIEAAPFQLTDAVEGARVLVEHRCMQEQVELAVDLPDSLPEVVGDRHELQQVVLNCLLNSLDVLASQEPPRRIAIDGRLDGADVILEIGDNGPGASPETLERALDPFFTAKGDPAASGLGLFISYSIVKNHGGEMRVSSEPGRGFQVMIALPARGAVGGP